MPVNIFESPIVPAVDLDSEVIVYVPGYAIKGPSEPTLVNASTFTSVFGDSPYIFKTSQTATVTKNSVIKGAKEKSWIYAKGLVDAGLTVLYHRFTKGLEQAKSNGGFTIYKGEDSNAPLATLKAVAKNKGSYYESLSVKMTPLFSGVTQVEVRIAKSETSYLTLESKNVSFDPEAENFIGYSNFANIDFVGVEGNTEVPVQDICNGLIADAPGAVYYGTSSDTWVELTLSNPVGENQDEFIINSMFDAPTEDEGEESEGEDPPVYKMLEALLDTDAYTVVYITSGGYFQSNSLAGKLMDIAANVKAQALVDLPTPSLTGTDADIETFISYRSGFSISTTDVLNKSFGAQFLGCDTYQYGTSRVILPDSYGYLCKLGGNLKSGIPAWVPVANNTQGNVSTGLGATRPVTKALSEEMISETGISVNPIVKKQNIGYVIMGNRTLYPNTGVLGPQSFLNCRLVVNSVERSARKAASSLLIVSTNPDAAFKLFKNQVEKTLDKMLANGDGLNSYNIKKLPKTKPATIDIKIELVVVEGIETFNIHIPYSIALDQ